MLIDANLITQTSFRRYHNRYFKCVCIYLYFTVIQSYRFSRTNTISVGCNYQFEGIHPILYGISSIDSTSIKNCLCRQPVFSLIKHFNYYWPYLATPHNNSFICFIFYQNKIRAPCWWIFSEQIHFVTTKKWWTLSFSFFFDILTEFFMIFESPFCIFFFFWFVVFCSGYLILDKTILYFF